MLNSSPKVTLFTEPRAGVKPRQAGCRTTCRASSMPHEPSGAAWRQEPMGTVAGHPLLASPGGGPPLPELPCKGTPAGGRAVQGNNPCPAFLVTLQTCCATEGKAHAGNETFPAPAVFIMGHMASGNSLWAQFPHLKIVELSRLLCGHFQIR